MDDLRILIVITAALWGAVFYRTRGGWEPFGVHIPRALSLAAFTLPLGLAVLAVGAPSWLGLVAWIVAAVFAAQAHAAYQDLGLWPANQDTAAYGWLLHLTGPRRRYWHDVAGIGLTGLTVSLPAGAAAWTADPIAAVALGLCGALKAPAYMLGWAVHRHIGPLHWSALNDGHYIGEALTGLFIGAAAGAVMGAR